MTAVEGGSQAPYRDVPAVSPWIAQLQPDGPPRPLAQDLSTDVVVVGAGIAGVATAFWTLRNTTLDVVLLERDRVGRGATGHNAGQLTTYFERPLSSIAAEYGEVLACEAQACIDGAHDLLDLMAAECQATVRVERFTGHMGMFTLNHVLVHLGNNLIRRRNGLPTESCVVSQDAEWLDDIPEAFASVYTVVPQDRVNELLGTRGEQYRAVLSDRKGCSNSGLLVQQVLAHLESTCSSRLHYADMTLVDRIVVRDGGVVVHAGGRAVTASHVVLCTNGFGDHVVVDGDGESIEVVEDQRVVGTIGVMAAFVEERMRPPTAISYIRNAEIGGDTPYVYVTRRTYDRPDDVVTLTCMGGPELPAEAAWARDMPVAGALLQELDETARPFAQPDRPPGLPYDFAWYGLMGYSEGRIRVVGRHPEHPSLMYNLGCNGIGFLPSIYGGQRISLLLAGDPLPRSIFDPRSASAG
jgi:glycine/D-amino acid oxidase-like deaminating enzyme